MGCEHTSVDRLLQVVNGTLLRGGGALVMVQPAELLENLGVLGVALENTLVGRLGAIKLEGVRSKATKSARGGEAYIFLLLVDMANLEPDVFLGQGARR